MIQGTRRGLVILEMADWAELGDDRRIVTMTFSTQGYKMDETTTKNGDKGSTALQRKQFSCQSRTHKRLIRGWRVRVLTDNGHHQT